MFELIEKILLAGKGLEKRAEKVLNSLAKEGEKKAPYLSSREDLENKLTEEGTRLASTVVKQLKEDKDKIEKKVAEVFQGLLEKLDIVTRDDIDVIEKMASKAREKADSLEKRIEELEKERKK